MNELEIPTAAIVDYVADNRINPEYNTFFKQVELRASKLLDSYPQVFPNNIDARGFASAIQEVYRIVGTQEHEAILYQLLEDGTETGEINVRFDPKYDGYQGSESFMLARLAQMASGSDDYADIRINRISYDQISTSIPICRTQRLLRQ